MKNDKFKTLSKKVMLELQTVNREFFVLEKSGRRHEIELLHRELSAFGIMQFVRSGRISITKDQMKITELLTEFKKLKQTNTHGNYLIHFH